MTYIHIPRKHLRQPQGRADIAWEDPITEGIVTVFNAGDLRDAVRVGTAQTTSIAAAGAYGGNQALVVDQATPGYVRSPIAGRVGNSLTMFAVAARSLVDNGGQAVMSVGAGNQRHLLYDALNKPALFSGNGGSYGQAIPAASTMPAAGVPFVIAGRVFGSASRDVWLNGNQVATDSTETLGVSGVDTAVMGAYWDNNSATLPWSGNLWLGALWNRALTNVELFSLTANPWRLFRADPVRIYSLPASSIPTLSALTASNVTSSGCRSTVTLAF